MSLPNPNLVVSRLVGSGQWERALEAAREWLGNEPENVRAHLAAGQSLVNLNRSAEAERHLNLVLASEPQNDFAHRLMSIVCFHGGRFKEADAAVQTAISLAPNDAMHWYHLARMAHHQGDLAAARRCVAHACELSPRDANILNLQAMCEPDDPSTGSPRKLQQYLAALELDPESAVIHNNIGAYHLNVTKDYATAEEFLRRALSLDPTCALFRSNLFLVLKQRDPIYRALCFPRDLFIKASATMRGLRQRNILIFLVLIPVWLVAIRFILAGWILWFTLVWPMVKMYERLTVGDLRAKAGEIGAQRGGFLGYRRWPLHVRLGICALAPIAFWGGVVLLLRSEMSAAAIGFGIIGGCIALLVMIFRRWIRQFRTHRHVRRRARSVQTLLPQDKGRPAPRPLRQFPPPLP